MPSHVGKLTPPRTLQAVMHLPQVHVPHISSLRLRYAFLDYSARLPYHSHLPVSRVEQTHSAGEPIRNYAPLARLRKPSPDRLIIPTPRLLVLQNYHARNRNHYHGAAISKTSIESVRRVQKEEGAV